MNARTLTKMIGLIFFMFMIFGCGGGSSGTDGGVTLKIQGTVSNNAGNALNGIEIQVLESGDSTTTDVQGLFNLPTSVTENSVTLLVKKGDSERVLETLLEVNEGDTVVYDISIDEADFSINVKSVTINPVPATPTPPEPSLTPAPIQDVIHGKIVTRSGEAVSNLSVKIKGTSNFTKTTSSGKFTLKGTLSRQEAVLVVSNSTKRVEVRLPHLPQESVVIDIELLFVIDSSVQGPGEPVVQPSSIADFEVKIGKISVN